MILCNKCIKKFFSTNAYRLRSNAEYVAMWFETLDNLLEQTKAYQNFQIKISYEPLFAYFTLFDEEFLYILESPDNIHPDKGLYISDRDLISNQRMQFDNYWNFLNSKYNTNIEKWVNKTKRFINTIVKDTPRLDKIKKVDSKTTCNQSIERDGE